MPKCLDAALQMLNIIDVINERKDDSALNGNDLLDLGFSPSQARAPCGVVEYTVKELRALFGSKTKPLSDHSLCLLHEAKKAGGAKVTSCE